jgi:hypothetical protein
MQQLNEALLTDLASHEATLCLSLYLEVSKGGGDHRHVRLALKNAQSEAAEAVRAGDAENPADVTAVIERLERLDYDDVTGAHDRRLAIFVAPELTEIVDTRAAETGVHVGRLFRLAPLIGELECTPDHAILMASQDEVRLYRVSDGALEEQAVDGLPGSLSSVSAFTDPQEKGNIDGREASGIPGSYQGPQAVDAGKSGTQGVPHHSMGGHDWRETKNDELRQYANRIINAAQHHLSGTNMPLVLAADEGLQGLLRQCSEYPFLASQGIDLHPRELGEEALRQAAVACLQGETEQRRKAAWDTLAASLGRQDGLASIDVTTIVTGAAAGQVAQLFVRSGASTKGRFDAASLMAEVDAGGDEDLIDRAIVETLRKGGEVFPIGDVAHAETAVAAAFRYPA